ncbi:MAG: phosphatidylserine/phosphatidylglycerophosphate/cardiolipin synthase family protein [Minwuia sp.]|nr:phosphatidylserine/phosphatidylglycerophosphate/cardiolipin synthase family protein [Minwuia sp.]
MARCGIPLVSSGSYPARAGNRIRPWIDGEPAFRRICQAIGDAQASVWVAVTFMWPEFRMPDDQGSGLDLLQRAASRGLDVRLIFWRPDTDLPGHRRNAFWGSAAHLRQLATDSPDVSVRWDRAHPGFCQHQKIWLIDADEDATATSFVGGINMNPHSLVSPGHHGAGQNHDAYVELAGPGLVDVHHNFVQRWNEASERDDPDGMAGPNGALDMAFPARIPSPRGDAVAEVQRTTHAGRYGDGHPTPGGASFDIAAGEQTNLRQYCAAMDAARHGIYIENQYLDVPDIIAALEGALSRGVEVVVVMPLVPDLSATIRAAPERPALLAARARLASYPNFCLSGIAGRDMSGRRVSVHVHAKLMLIDDAWATVGSCNLHRYSLFGNGELNVAFHDPSTVRDMRIELFQEHLDTDTSALDDKAALRLFRHVALANRNRHQTGNADWQGLAIAMNVATYGDVAQF